jgi:hypothetical protein
VQTLDLHGEKYEVVQQRVHSFVYNNDLPVRIITGKSSAMRKIVVDTVGLLGYHSHYERLINEGSLIITEQEF